jgi:pimeloyl-ACP methyl ester carboxylesterase
VIYTMHINDVDIAFDDQGYAPDAPAIVLLTGWAHDHRAWTPLLPLIRDTYRVVRVCWRGHGPDRSPIGDFGIDEQVDDTIRLLDALDIESFVPLSHAHGGWVGLEMADQLGTSRVPAVMLLDLIMTPPPPEFALGVAALQDRSTWQTARDALLRSWLSGSTNDAVLHHVLYEAGGHGFDMWARSGRVIENAYRTWGSPMGRMLQMSAHPQVRHLFSHPDNTDYDQLHATFATENPWFSYRRLGGGTHFPGLELPETVATELTALIATTTPHSINM